MHSKYNKPLLIIAVLSLLAAVLADGFFGGQGLGTVVSSLVMILSFCVCTIMASRDTAAAKRDADLRNQMVRDAQKTPVFAHVPGPGEPGYDPDYDPDDDKYWRRYY